MAEQAGGRTFQPTCWEVAWAQQEVELDKADDSEGKESTCNVGDLSLIPGLGRFPGEGKMAAHSSSLA